MCLFLENLVHRPWAVSYTHLERKEISKAVISRLPRYYRYLGELIEEGVERISSNELSSRMILPLPEREAGEI